MSERLARDKCPSCGAELHPGNSPVPICVRCAFDFALQDDIEDIPTTTSMDSPDVRSRPIPRGRIGPYLPRRVLGEGGMGIVWEAEQEEPVRRRVALKCIRVGMDGGQFQARFESERQALALMSHPNIARAYDAGCTADGLPYFAMELIDGLWITRYCDAQALSLRQRLELFMEVCRGVQHAHQRGVIHRDIKPSNILVQTEEGRPVPKIIDFGVAKAMGPALTDRTLVTQLGQTLGTPAYMSPEQAGAAGFDVDTRTDVYSLGALLYELLTGHLPVEGSGENMDALRRRIREEEPVRPSARVAALGIEGPGSRDEVARLRGTQPAALVKTLKGDLDWIIIKALAKDRAHRYGSPDELSADLGRYLNSEPVLAGPPSAVYRARKFVRRHRFGMSAAALGVAGVIGFGVVMAVEADRIAHERDRANAEAMKAQKVSGFLEGLFQSIDPTKARGKEVTVREVLDAGRSKIQKELEAQPEIEVPLLLTLGNVYRNLGAYAPAYELLGEAVKKSRAVNGPNARISLTSERGLAAVYFREGKHKEAQAIMEPLLPRCRAILGKDDLETLQQMNLLGIIYFNLGLNKEAEPILREAVDGLRRVSGSQDPLTLSTINNLAHTYRNLFRYKEAEALCREAFENEKRILGPDHIDTLMTMDDLAGILSETGRFTEAEQLYREDYTIRSRVLGKEHDLTLDEMDGLAGVLNNQGRYEEVERIYRELYEIQRRLRGEEDIRTLNALDGVASAYLNQGNYREGEKLERQIAEAASKTVGPDDRRTLGALWGVALAADAQGRQDEARSIYSQIFERSRRVRGASETLTLQLEGNLAGVTAHLGRFNEAESLAQDMLKNCQGMNGNTNPNTSTALYELARISALRGRKAQALDYLHQTKAAGNGLVTENFLRDRDFNSLRGDPEFERIVAAEKADAEKLAKGQ